MTVARRKMDAANVVNESLAKNPVPILSYQPRVDETSGASQTNCGETRQSRQRGFGVVNIEPHRW
jgi:hypothetical protein